MRVVRRPSPQEASYHTRMSPGGLSDRAANDGDRSGWHSLAVFGAWFYVVAMVLKAAAPAQVADLDMFHEMALFRYALEVGGLPRTDPFAYTPTVEPFVHHEWGMGALLYLASVASGLGASGLLAFRYVLLAILVVLCYQAARLRGSSGALMVACAPISIVLLVVGLSTLRAHMVSFVATGALLCFLELDRRGKRWWIPVWLVLYVVWLNVHGGFVVGGAIAGAYLLEQLWRARTEALEMAFREHRHLVLVLVAMAILPLVNPYGWSYLPFLWEALSMDRPLVAEWAPLWDPRVARGVQVAFAASFVPVMYSLATRAESRRVDVFVLLVLAVAGVKAQRMLPFYAIAWFSVVPGWLAASKFGRLIEMLLRGRWRLAAVATLTLGIIPLSRALSFEPWQLRIPTVAEPGELHYPAGAVDYLAEVGFNGNVMTPFNVGAYVTWRLFPAVLVGMDSRYEVAYPPAAAEENHLLYRAMDGWKEVLSRYPTEIVLTPASGPLDTALSIDESVSRQWVPVYRDDGYSLFARADLAPSLPAVDRRGEVIEATFP